MKKDIKNNHNYHTRSKVNKGDVCKNNESSDDDSEWETDEDLDMDDIRKLIGDIFPSNYMKNKIIKGEEQGENTKMKKQFKKMKDKYDEIIYGGRATRKRVRSRTRKRPDETESREPKRREEPRKEKSRKSIRAEKDKRLRIKSEEEGRN